MTAVDVPANDVIPFTPEPRSRVMLTGSAPLGVNAMAGLAVGVDAVRSSVPSVLNDNVCAVVLAGVKPAGRFVPSICQSHSFAAVFQKNSLRSCWLPNESYTEIDVSVHDFAFAGSARPTASNVPVKTGADESRLPPSLRLSVGFAAVF